MLSFKNPAVYQSSKCYVTYGIMGHLDPNQPPSKGKPWTSLTSQGFIHRADLIVPEEAFEAVRTALVRNATAPEYRRVVMSLHDILSGDFYTKYIRTGNVMMISEGRRGIDNVFSLKDGVLTMFLDKEAYERAGLVGKPHGVKGKRGLKPRWVVEYNLKADSMFHGKKGFDRLVYASKNALGSPVTWLFCNVSGETPIPDPLLQFSSTSKNASPQVSSSIDAMLPPLQPTVESLIPAAREDFESFAAELYEWISLVRLGSPRICPGNSVDPFLSRYQVPSAEKRARIRKVSWEGFISPSWSRKTLIDVVAVLPAKFWFSFSTTTLSTGVAGDNSECAILRPPDLNGEYLMWEVKSHE